MFTRLLILSLFTCSIGFASGIDLKEGRKRVPSAVSPTNVINLKSVRRTIEVFVKNNQTLYTIKNKSGKIINDRSGKKAKLLTENQLRAKFPSVHKALNGALTATSETEPLPMPAPRP